MKVHCSHRRVLACHLTFLYLAGRSRPKHLVVKTNRETSLGNQQQPEGDVPWIWTRWGLIICFWQKSQETLEEKKKKNQQHQCCKSFCLDMSFSFSLVSRLQAVNVPFNLTEVLKGLAPPIHQAVYLEEVDAARPSLGEPKCFPICLCISWLSITLRVTLTACRISYQRAQAF